MIRVIIDADGLLELDGESYPAPNDPSDFRSAGIDVPTTLDVDTTEFNDSLPLVSRHKGSFLVNYKAPSEDETAEGVWFCRTKLQEIFGEVPDQIWYKEVYK